ncbi:unnamed protein product [Lasius platythorax]|uniref:Uncharacterized protein n=1 Tax=Lasius platythorax TaxID=488582 RepID=A0AAV2P5K2_9HYME
MTVAEEPRDRARRETQLELNWSVLGRAFGRETEMVEGWRTSRIFLGFLRRRRPGERSFLTDSDEGSDFQKSM